MKSLFIVLLLSSVLFGSSLNLKSGFVGAHTQMLMDSKIDPLNINLQANVSMYGDDVLTLRGKLWIDMDDFISENTYRDEHMDDANNIVKFPEASYVISSVTKSKKKNMYVIHGSLTYHGKTKVFKLDAEIFTKNEELIINATSTLLLSDYNVDAPCMVFMCVRDKVDIFARAVLVK